MQTRAAVCRAFEAPLSIDPPGEVLIRTAACAICHSDISYIDGAWGGDLPAAYGHDAATRRRAWRRRSGPGSLGSGAATWIR